MTAVVEGDHVRGLGLLTEVANQIAFVGDGVHTHENDRLSVSTEISAGG